MPADRFSRLLSALTARERAVLVLRAFKGGSREDPSLRRTMPLRQVPEFNRFVYALNAANIHTGHLISLLHGRWQLLEERWLRLAGLHEWRLNLAEIGYHASLVTSEPVTEAHHTRLVAQQAALYLPLATLAAELAELQRSWPADDLQQVWWSSTPVVADQAWQELCAAAEGTLRDAIAEGSLKARGNRQALAVRRGEFDAWLGRRPTATPAWASGFQVRPDADAAAVERDRVALDDLQAALRSTPLQRLAPEGDPPSLDQQCEALQSDLAAEFSETWAALGAVEAGLEELGDLTYGEDPLRPALRERLVALHAGLLDLSERLVILDVAVDLPDPDPEVLDLVRESVKAMANLLG